MLHQNLTHVIVPLPLSFPAVAAQRLRQRLLRPIRSCRRLTSDGLMDGKGMKWFHEIELEVRDYELDRFGVVNNSVYNNYCEYGSNQLIDKIGLDGDTKLAHTQASYKYIAPLRKKDKFLLKVRIYDYSGVRLYLEDLILKLPDLEPILECKATIVLLDKRLNLIPIPPSMISKFGQFVLHGQKERRSCVKTLQ